MTVSKFKILHLMTRTCLIFGQHPALTSPKVAQYVLGTRETIEILKMYELRYLLLKVYPLIHNLFSSPRFNTKLKIKKNWKANFQLPEKSLPRTANHVFSGPRVWPFETKTSFSVKQRQAPPQILFASITPAFSKIIAKAAEICNMPWHENRWLNGSITAAISYPSDKLVWQYLQDSTQDEIVASFSDHWGQNKENEEKIKEKIKYYGKSRWPSLLVIPDVFNNLMILDEGKKVGLPIIGLVNSNCPIEIEYPIFAQDQTSQSIHFFCQFLAILIVKETLFFQHKRHIMQKIKKKKRDLLAKTQILTLEKNKNLQQSKEVWKKPFFFKVVQGWQYRRKRRYLFGIKPGKALKSFKSSKLNIFSFRQGKYIPYVSSQNEYWKIQKWCRQSFLKKNKMAPLNKNYKIKKNYKKSSFLYKGWMLEARHFTFAKNIFKKFKMSFRRTVRENSKKKKPRLILAANLFKKEYQKKYFQKNNLIPEEQKKLYYKFQNFLGFSNVIRQYTKYYNLTGTKRKRLGYPKSAQYFWWSLKQWFQNVKWHSPRELVKPTLGLDARKRHGILRYKHLFYRRGYKRDPNNPITPWQSWMSKNKKNLFQMKFKPKNKTISKFNSLSTLSNNLSALPLKNNFNVSNPPILTRVNKKKLQTVAFRKLARWFHIFSTDPKITEEKYIWHWTTYKNRRRYTKKLWPAYSVKYLRLSLKDSFPREWWHELAKPRSVYAGPLRKIFKERISDYLDQFHKEDLQRSELNIQKKTFETKLPESFFQPWKKIDVFLTEKQHWLNTIYVRYKNLRFKDRIDFFKTYVGQIIGSTYWQKELDTDYNFYIDLYKRPQSSFKRKYFKFKTLHKKGWWYDNLIKKTHTSPSAKKYILDRPKTAFQAHWTQRKLEPWKDALLFKRALYAGFHEEYRKENRFEILKMKKYLRRKNPRQEKRNRLYGKANFLLNNFRQRSRLRADKLARIKQVTGKILRPFYGHLRPGQIKYLVKKSKNVKSDILSYNEIILSHLENRLDVVIYRINLAPSILWARRLIKAGFIFVTPETNRLLWESMYRGLKKFSFPLKLRDPKNLYAKTYWTEDQETWVELKFLGQPNKKISYLLQKGDLIQCAEGTYMNHFKTQSWLCRKPMPKHLLNSQKKKYTWDWRSQKYKHHTFNNWEQNSPYIFSTIFLNNPQYRDLDSKDRVKESFWRWAIL